MTNPKPRHSAVGEPAPSDRTGQPPASGRFLHLHWPSSGSDSETIEKKLATAHVFRGGVARAYPDLKAVIACHGDGKCYKLPFQSRKHKGSSVPTHNGVPHKASASERAAFLADLANDIARDSELARAIEHYPKIKAAISSLSED